MFKIILRLHVSMITACFFSVMVCVFAHADTYQESVTLEDVSRLAVAKNLDIQVLRQDIRIQSHQVGIHDGQYDAFVETDISFVKDRSPSASVFAPSKSENLDMSAAVTQRVASGTQITAQWLSNRRESDSIFVLPNPSYDIATGILFEQSVGKNAFGVIDRAKLSQVRIDTKRYSYDRLRQMEIRLHGIRQLYYRAIADQNKHEIAKEALKDAIEFDRASKEKLRIGILELPDKLAAEANVKRREITVLVSANRYQDALNRLKNALMFPLDLNLLLKSVESASEVNDSSLSYSNRYDWLALQQQKQWMQLQVKISRSNLLPDATLDGGVVWSGLNRRKDAANDDAFSNQFPEYSVSFDVRMPIQNRSAQSELKQTKSELDRLELEIESLRREIDLDIEETEREVVDAGKSVSIAESILDLQQRKLDAEMRRFDQGRSGSDIIIRFQEDLLSAKEALTDQKTFYLIALDDVRLAKGMLLRPYFAGEGDVE